MDQQTSPAQPSPRHPLPLRRRRLIAASLVVALLVSGSVVVLGFMGRVDDRASLLARLAFICTALIAHSLAWNSVLWQVRRSWLWRVAYLGFIYAAVSSLISTIQRL